MIYINDRTVGAVDAVNVANDKEVIRLEFKCKNQVTDLLKLTDCDAVFINYQNGSTKDRYAVTDITEDGEYVTFSWLLGRNATRAQGKTYFIVCAQISEDDEIVQKWNTALASFDVRKGLETITAPPEPLEDIFEQLVEMINGKLAPSNIKAGQNVTVNISGNDVTISAQGGEVDAYTKAETDALLAAKVSTTELGAEETARENADLNLQGQIDAITVSSDVVDVVGTYAELQAYDTSHIKANDIVKVLQDSTHSNALSYYRWVITGGAGAWVYVGSEGPFYTKGEADALLNNKADNSALADYVTVAAMNAGLATKQDAIPVISGEKTVAELVALGVGQYVVGSSGLEITGVLYVEDGETEIELISVEGDNVLVGGNVLFLDANSDCYKILKVDDGETITYQGSAVATWADVTWIKNNYAFDDYYGGTCTAINTENGLYRTNEPCTVTVKTGSASSRKDVIEDFEGIMIRTDMQFVMLGTVNRIYTKASSSQAYFANKEDIGSPLTFSNLSVEIADWVADSTYSGYGYKAVLTCAGVTSNMVADVYFNGASAILGTLAPFCDTGNGTVTIYCSANDSAVTIDKVVAV